jgi:hypothetical protein
MVDSARIRAASFRLLEPYIIPVDTLYPLRRRPPILSGEEGLSATPRRVLRSVAGCRTSSSTTKRSTSILRLLKPKEIFGAADSCRRGSTFPTSSGNSANYPLKSAPNGWLNGCCSHHKRMMTKMNKIKNQRIVLRKNKSSLKRICCNV